MSRREVLCSFTSVSQQLGVAFRSPPLLALFAERLEGLRAEILRPEALRPLCEFLRFGGFPRLGPIGKASRRGSRPPPGMAVPVAAVPVAAMAVAMMTAVTAVAAGLAGPSPGSSDASSKTHPASRCVRRVLLLALEECEYLLPAGCVQQHFVDVRAAQAC